MKADILKALKELGFKLDKVDNDAYVFMYEGYTLLVVNTADDESFLQISMINVVTVEDENPEVIFGLMDQINSKVPYVKSFIRDESVWISYERELLGNEDHEELMREMIRRLDYSARFLYRTYLQLTRELSEPLATDEKDGDDTPVSEMSTDKKE